MQIPTDAQFPARERIKPSEPSISVVIPCYNDGEYLAEAVESVLNQTYQEFEIIIVDDGSTDESSLAQLNGLEHSKIQVLHTRHGGLANARNTAINAARGTYILPLDADDRVAETYLEQAVSVFDSSENVGIVYSKAELFGEQCGLWNLPPYHFPEILLGNVIFSSAFFRKRDWAAVNGYNPNMIYGWEDYDFWLSIIELGREVVRIPETLFFYRKRPNSMIRTMNREQMLYSYAQLFNNHRQLYSDNIAYLLLNSADKISNYQKSIESSWSWRLTKPFRGFNQLIRQIRRRLEERGPEPAQDVGRSMNDS
jgi:glycosyltransferase involved in cell wall biosynthesis